MQQLKNISLVLGIAFSVFFISFMVLAWTPPNQAPTLGNVVLPINVGSGSQVKDGALSISGVFETHGLTRLARGNYSSVVIVGTAVTSSDLLVYGNVVASYPVDDSHLATKKYVDDKVTDSGQGSFLGVNFHTESNCTSVGGAVWTTPEGIKICRITSPTIDNLVYAGVPCYFYWSQATTVSCPSGWQQYRNWSTTHPTAYRYSNCASGCQSLVTPYHGWSDKAVEVVSYNPCAGCTGSCPQSISAKIVEIGCY